MAAHAVGAGRGRQESCKSNLHWVIPQTEGGRWAARPPTGRSGFVRTKTPPWSRRSASAPAPAARPAMRSSLRVSRNSRAGACGRDRPPARARPEANRRNSAAIRPAANARGDKYCGPGTPVPAEPWNGSQNTHLLLLCSVSPIGAIERRFHRPDGAQRKQGTQREGCGSPVSTSSRPWLEISDAPPGRQAEKGLGFN